MTDVFSSAVKKSIARELDATGLLSTVEQLNRAGEQSLMLELYKIWLRTNADNPMAYAIWFNFGTALSNANDLPAAKEALSESVKSNTAFAPGYINLASVYERLGQNDQAVKCWSQGADCVPGITPENILHKTTALKQIGRVLEAARQEATAEQVLRQSLEINPNQRDVVQHWLALRQVQCIWPALAPVGSLTEVDLLRSISPLSLAVHSDDPIAQLANAHAYNRNDVVRALKPARITHVPRQADTLKRLRIGYLSSDLRDHAVGFLMSEVLELHDATQVETYAYYCGIPANDATQQRFKAAANHWRDISKMSDDEAAAVMTADAIDILVDLNGYTKDARLKLVAMTPAPIIINWLGFPGTMGSSYHHYIIADSVTIPADSERYYSEQVLRIGCYQPNDRKRVVSSTRMLRADAGLPENAFVYCCFNGTQKITRAVFDTWMTILSRTNDSVLWLLSGTDATNARLRQYASDAGIAPERLVFAPRMGNPEHLARLALADVFLDTAPYGAHTTASDALWMGVPVLTVPGRSFASRVCASLVTAAGQGALVCENFSEYIEKACAFYVDTPSLRRIKATLRHDRDRCRLFDTPKLVRELEEAYRTAWNDYIAGRLHRPDLSNVEVFHEIGCELNAGDVAEQFNRDRREIYRRMLLERGAFSTFVHDNRLSTSSEAKPARDYKEARGASLFH